MKVKQLIKKLEKLNQNAEVFVSSDAEMNSFGRLVDLEDNLKVSIEESGETVFWSTEDISECKVKGLKNAIMLFPE